MKKLLLILIALPMIGFGQDDKIIFSSGDTIYGKVIEVGVNDITYQHKDETTNNVSKKRELAKVIYSSGRVETFQGLSILESKIEGEENEKLYIQRKEERKLIQKNYKKSFEIGALFGASFNSNTAVNGFEKKKHTTTIQGLILKYNYQPNFSFHTELNYHITGWSRSYSIGEEVDPQRGFIYPPNEDNDHIKLANHYISIPLTIEYSFNLKPKFIFKSGFYASYLIKSIYTRNLSGEEQSQNSDLKQINRYDYGGILGVGLSYPINDKISILFDCTAYYGLVNYYVSSPIYYVPSPIRPSSKNRTGTAIIGLTYNLKNK